ncbi:UDP-N-acetylmuramate dehydrogenase [Mangrovibacter yixingensis]|uniref:UDP-N-acetylmuramate dehydrogenase n=1 Tax=Mangrovibacter yixingensis TaxID=1529639 RepID=UPI001CFCBF2F|nr:UDP-N-acetylmuramate dehydrogenase [Mangrovibacter yixingensis]
MSNTLKPFHTFGIDVSAQHIVIADSAADIVSAWQSAQSAQQPALIVGEGSNLLFLDDFSGTVILNRIEGIRIEEDSNNWLLHVGAGENWHHLVEFTLQQGIPGLENLALIPGCVGSSPIQNIGAYGREIKDVCAYVDCINLQTSEVFRLNAEQCQFAYRDSIFKHEYKDRVAIVAVGFQLPKQWVPLITYGDLTQLAKDSVTPQQIFDAVCHMRRTKLPDPAIQGNAGSFFKNPVVDTLTTETLIQHYPTIPHYPQLDGSVKLAAGWLIDQCGLKGSRVGGAAVHQKQALVLVNDDNATSEDVVRLAHKVRQLVGEKFNVWLEPEVRFIGRQGEVSAVETIA